MNFKDMSKHSFSVGDRVFTRDGREVEILKVDAPNSVRPILGMDLVTGTPNLWRENGRYFGLDEDGPSNKDLLPPKRTREVTVWVNVYSNEVYTWGSEIEARNEAGDDALAVAVPATVKVEW